MPLDKSIQSGKEHRKQYCGGKAIAKSCRNHGGCEWCLSNRKYRYIKIIQSCNQKEGDYKRGEV